MDLLKRTTLVFTIVLMAMALTISCNKDDDEEPETPSLQGTVWESVMGTETFTLTFTSNSDFNAHYIDTSDNTVENTTGTYTYNPPTITLVNATSVETGTVTGNTMTFNSGFIFTKK